ncbi:Ubiquinone/menaquinone biosynthesis C-methyltransferase UbiE (plasmid) [Streptomyces sp. YIM 121038]|uniref:class I SAM-dependent methyltransferase n=1 Tax=Streptomyces sp. YIM 121038 TaxID=2136401 RepID=UPI001110A95B|nr:class I SAM-dependent methyltransferase [Streptomyces sp. YIM 121038]QCX82850.1 Ubiquinone/menaquinone biosynthesis C-methyltransferase UbiE [Streptomyces sp. YIM 121038]
MTGFDVQRTYDLASKTYNELRDLSSSLVTVTDTITRNLDISSGDRILDVGCGTGSVSLSAARLATGAGSVVGVDISQSMVEFARINARNAGVDNIEFIVCDMDEFNFPAESFDSLACALALFFSRDMPEVISSFWRLLRPGGRLALATLGRNILHPVSGAFLDLAQLYTPDLDVSAPWNKVEDLSHLRRLVEEAGTYERISLDHQDAVMNLESAKDGWEYLMGSGFRNYIMQLDKDTVERIRRDINEWMERNAIRHLTLGVNYVTAVKST